MSPPGCAPREADYPISERARAAPAPSLTPTAEFAAPLSTGREAATRLAEDTAALAAKAEALRARGAALSDAEVLGEAERARLTNAAPAVE